jgi:hypothetical protein
MEAHIAALPLTVDSPLARLRADDVPSRGVDHFGFSVTSYAQLPSWEYVGQQGPHKLVITSQWVALDEFDATSSRHPE